MHKGEIGEGEGPNLAERRKRTFLVDRRQAAIVINYTTRLTMDQESSMYVLSE